MGADIYMGRVVVKECKSYNIAEVTENVNSGIELLGGWGAFLGSGMKVLLKVNLISPKDSDTAAVTHCEFVRAVVRILKARGCEVWIGDSSGGMAAGKSPTAQSFVISGIQAMAEEEGATIKNFDLEGVVELDGGDIPGGSLQIAKPLVEADLVINLPKLKTHMLGLYTGAIKNMYGAIPGLKKTWYHKMAPDPVSFGKVLAAINKAVPPALHIMDAIVAMEGAGPTAGKPYNSGRIFMATDPLALDTAACKLIGLDISRLPMYKASIEARNGEWNLSGIELLGDFTHIASLKGFKIPNKIKLVGGPLYSLFSKGLDMLEKVPVVDRKLCRNCNVCVNSCPMSVIDVKTKVIDYSKCIKCMCCHELCTFEAINFKNKRFV